MALGSDRGVLGLEWFACDAELQLRRHVVVGRLVLHVLLEVELRVAGNRTSWISTGPMVKFERMKQLLE